MKKVGVERALSNVSQYLESKNCQVVVLDEAHKESSRSLNKLDAIVVSGADMNLMGMQDIMTEKQVIDARGKSAEEVYSEIMNRTGGGEQGR